MAKIVCDACGVEFDDENLKDCPTCGCELSKLTDKAMEKKATLKVNKPFVADAQAIDEMGEESADKIEFTGENKASFSETGSNGDVDSEILEARYNDAVSKMENLKTNSSYAVYMKLAGLFEAISGYRNSDDLRTICLERAEGIKKDNLYKSAIALEASSKAEDVEKALEEFSKIPEWKEAKKHIKICEEKLAKASKRSSSIFSTPEPMASVSNLSSVSLSSVSMASTSSNLDPLSSVPDPFSNKMSDEEWEKRRKKTKKLTIIISSAVSAVLAITLLTIFLIVPSIKYGKAVNLLEDGEYNDAYTKFGEVINFRDSTEKMDLIAVLYSMEKGKYIGGGRADIDLAIKEMIATDHDVTITYNHGYEVDGAYKKEDVEISKEDPFLGVVTPVRHGYEFVDYKIEDYGFAHKNAFIVIRASWNDDYSITIDLDGGEKKDSSGNRINYPDEYSVEDKDDIIFDNPTRYGYTFTGWTGTEISEKTMSLKITAGSFGDREYKANWEANEYKLTYDANGGTVSITSDEVVFDSNYVMPIPTRTGYVFKGWVDKSGNSIAQTEKWSVASDLDLKADWEKEVYYITYKDVEAEGNDLDYSYMIGDPAIKLIRPVKKGYSFLGWYSDSAFTNKITEIDTSALTSVTVYAKWRIVEYDIDYLYSGSIPSSFKKTFTVEDLPYTLPDLNVSGFVCWVDEDYKEIEEITEVVDTELRAKFYDSTGKIYYISDKNGYILYDYNGTASSLTISKYNSKNIIEIYDEAFENCTSITSVTIGSSVKYIGDSAFDGCSNLKSVTIPESVTTIGSYAFDGCHSSLKIKCKAAEKPAGWSNYWNGDADYEFGS